MTPPSVPWACARPFTCTLPTGGLPAWLPPPAWTRWRAAGAVPSPEAFGPWKPPFVRSHWYRRSGTATVAAVYLVFTCASLVSLIQSHGQPAEPGRWCARARRAPADGSVTNVQRSAPTPPPGATMAHVFQTCAQVRCALQHAGGGAPCLKVRVGRGSGGRAVVNCRGSFAQSTRPGARLFVAAHPSPDPPTHSPTHTHTHTHTVSARLQTCLSWMWEALARHRMRPPFHGQWPSTRDGTATGPNALLYISVPRARSISPSGTALPHAERPLTPVCATGAHLVGCAEGCS